MPKLTAPAVRNAPPGRHHDGDGLYLNVQPGGARSWVLRVQADGKRRDIGLGTADLTPRSTGKGESSPIDIPLLHRKLLTLSEAREKARMLREAAKAGLDPVLERDRERRSIPKFREAAKGAHAAWKDGRKEKEAATFLRSLELHAYPVIGDMRVDAITAADISNVLSPIWTSKPDMGRKVRQRIGRVLNYAHAKGWRPTEAPVKSVTAALPRQPKGGNYKAMPWADVPKFVAILQSKAQTVGRQATLFQLLTAVRPGEARGARWEQIDIANKEWRIPAEMMKTGEPHTVTLNTAALALLEEIRTTRPGKSHDLVFPGRQGSPMSDMTMNKMLRDAGFPYDAHGFRSSFRDWHAETISDAIPDAVAEAALAHAVPDKVERAYKRTKFIAWRRELLEAWGRFALSVEDVK
ncbi:tyrosine-type recombinase/integrase [Sphingomonas sp. Mn802worker]|uniref:tyrosine-type recombinase/integrase n=1 Tax=Sphingomonas sp. Mn802worker TaxID=629773 RepID=UPI00056D1CA4|nr:site-specific integrase [Sphingomonas sp. Mn802worker]